LFKFGLGTDLETSRVRSQDMDSIDWLTHLGFAITSSTIISGCMAERTHIMAYVTYTCFNLMFMVRPRHRAICRVNSPSLDRHCPSGG
jgi:ammonia channel protein AmtB